MNAKRFTYIPMIVAIVAAAMCFSGSASATTTSTKSTWQKGYTADATHTESRMVVTTREVRKKVCVADPDSDRLMNCKQGALKADGTRKLLPAGVYVVKALPQKCGSVLQLKGVTVKRGGAWEVGSTVYSFHRYCSGQNTFYVAYFEGKGAGVDTINVACPSGAHRVRTWRLYPGPNGNITDPGLVNFTAMDGTTVLIGGENASRPFGQRYWEFYDHSNRKVDVNKFSDISADPIEASPDAGPNVRLVLALSDCLGE